ncbi:AAA family ATPase [Streptomyces cyaneofuscatus]
MKLKKLTVMGLRSYTAPCTIDFTDRHLFAIFGDTGDGKSSLPEAIIYSLFGTCSWSKSAQELISRGAPSMHTSLEFEVDDQSWIVRRIEYADPEKRPEAVLEPLSGNTASMRVDHKKAVNEAITDLLGMDRDGFIATFMPRQGDFNALLRSTPAVQARILRHVFGISSLERVRDTAETRLKRLEEQIDKAREARGDLGKDPRAAADQAALDVERTGGVARSRRERLNALREARELAAERHRHKRDVDKATQLLRSRAVPDAGTTLVSLTHMKSELDEEAAAQNSTEHELNLKLDAAQSALSACEQAGDTLPSLHGVFAVLSRLPDRAASLSAVQQRQEQEQEQHAEHQRELDEAQQALAEGEPAFAELAAAAARSKDLAAEARTWTEEVKDGVREALQEATSASVQMQSYQAALKATEEHRQRCSAAVDTREELSSALEAAQDHLAAVHRKEAAHTAGSGLTPGDDCTVCARSLPDGFTPPAPLDGKELGRAKRAATKYGKLVEGAVVAEAQAAGALNATEATSLKHHRAHLAAMQATEAALLRVRERADAARATCSPAAAVALESLHGQTKARAHLLAEGNPASRQQITRMVSALVQPLLDAEGEARTAHTDAEAALAAAQAEREAAKAEIKRRRGRLRRESKRLDGLVLECDTELQTLLTDIAGLPSSLRPAQPDPNALPAPHDIAAAIDTTRRRLEQLEKTTQQRDDTRQALAEHAANRQALDERRRHTIEVPARRLVKQLERWADAADDAADLVGDETATLPAAPNGTDLAAVDSYRLSVVSLDRRLTETLSREAEQACAEVLAFEKELVRQGAGPEDANDSAPGFFVPSQGDLLDPSILKPLVNKTDHAHSAYERAKDDQRIARSRIPRAEALDAALMAGKRQAEHWRIVRKLLTEGKFIGYLVKQRTQTLLSHASRNLQEISGGSYAFTEAFEIVDCATHLARNPQTLSGGESFQASLALAMALVELNSRSRGHRRLKTLFLDEGFGSLDAEHLDLALAFLGRRIAPDTTIAIISHMYPVADEVDDILHVMKPAATGSTARWLSPEERTSIVYDGLQKMLHYR